jgi:hypothetical protein
MASPEPEQPCEKRENKPDRYANKELVRQDARKSRSDENAARHYGNDDAEERANIQSGKKAPNNTRDGAPLREHPLRINTNAGASSTFACSVGERIKLTSAISPAKPNTGHKAVNGSVARADAPSSLHDMSSLAGGFGRSDGRRDAAT